jgi:signal transduction histidine kinase
MLKLLIPEHLRKDWLLHFSGFITWSVVCYISLVNMNVGGEFFLKLIAFVIFYISFAWIIFVEDRSGILLNKVLLGIEIIIVLLLISLDKYKLSAILLVLIATVLPPMFTRKQSIILIILITIAHFVLYYSYFGDNFLTSLLHVIIYFMLQIFGFSAIETALREAKAKEELAAINQELLATRFMLKSSSQRQERLRISRDLHDAIGHQLTGLSLNLEVAKHKVPEEFKPLLQENLQLAKTLLTDVRQVVKEMRDEEQFDLISSLNNLISQLPNCQLAVISSPEINSLRLKQQLMFCLQEGISNALRHGKANHFTLDSKKIDNSLMIELSNNGSIVAENTPSSFGSGLTGLNERLVDFSGKVTLVANNNGCTLKIEVEDCYD